MLFTIVIPGPIMIQYSWNALMSASEQGHAEVVRILLKAGTSRSHTKDKVV